MNNKSRTLINVIGIPIIVSTILIGDFLFTLFVSSIILLGTKEYVELLKKYSIHPLTVLLYLFQIFLILNSLIFTAKKYHGFDECYSTHFEFIIISFLPVIFIFFGMIVEIFKKSPTPLFNISSTIFGFIWIGIFINSLVYLRYEAGHILTLVIFLSVWTCDTCAFFFGKKFGKTKIMPEISPNKTILGTISGLLGTIIFLLTISYFNFIELNILESFILALITGGISQFGDFFESKLKREVNIKDTSNILSGHGGVLDRFDSLAIIAPLLLLFTYIVK